MMTIAKSTIIFLALPVLFASSVHAQGTLESIRSQCRSESIKEPVVKSKTITGVAEDEWRRFGAYSRVAGGQYFTAEDSWTELSNPADAKIESLFAWARVYLFWKAAGNTGALDMAYDVARTGEGQPVRGGDGILRKKVNLNSSLLLMEKASASAGGATLPPSVLQAFRIAATRASLTEQPWSAVFISTVMKLSELSNAEFQPSASHSGYMRDALKSSKGLLPANRYMACPPEADVRPRPGDLICNARAGTKAGFMTLWNASSGFSSHCDVVTSVTTSQGSFTIKSVGGNVQDNVTQSTYTGKGLPSLAGISQSGKWIAVLLLR